MLLHGVDGGLIWKFASNAESPTLCALSPSVILGRRLSCLYRLTLMKHKGSQVDFAWENEEKQRILINVLNATTGTPEAELTKLRVSHIPLLIANEPDLVKMLQPLLSRLDGLSVEGGRGHFRREVPVGQMDGKDITQLMGELIERKLAAVGLEAPSAQVAKQRKGDAPLSPRTGAAAAGGVTADQLAAALAPLQQQIQRFQEKLDSLDRKLSS